MRFKIKDINFIKKDENEVINLLHVITELELGGAQKITLYLAENHNKSIFNVFFVSSPKGFLINKVLKCLPSVKVCLTPFFKRKINPLYDLIAFFWLIYFLKTNKIDIIHTHSSKAGIIGRWAARFSNVPVIIHTYHGFGFNPFQNFFIRNFFILLEKITSKITNVLIFVSKDNFKTAEKLKIGNFKKNEIIYEGVEKIYFEKHAVPTKAFLNLKNKEIIAGMVAPLKAQKAPFDFLKIARKVLSKYKNIKFYLIGSGKLKTKLENEIKKLNLEERVILLGWKKNVYNILQTFDISILTSYWEGLPIFLLESMFLKIPVVAYKTDGVKDIIKNTKNGFLINQKDICDFAEKILVLAKNKNIRKRMGNNAYDMVKYKFNLKSMLDKTETLYLDFLNKKNV